MNIFQISKREEFGKLLGSMGLNGYGMEIGVATGVFSKVLIETSGLKKIFLLDMWHEFKEGYRDINNVCQRDQDIRYVQVVKDMVCHSNRVVVIKDSCEDASFYIQNDVFDFIYLDANHNYNSVSKSLEEWYPKVKKGGIFAGHDYLDGVVDGTEFGVKSAVDQFAGKRGINIFTTNKDGDYPSWYLQK